MQIIEVNIFYILCYFTIYNISEQTATVAPAVPTSVTAASVTTASVTTARGEQDLGGQAPSESLGKI